MNKENIFNSNVLIGNCNLKDIGVDLYTFEYKGCWNCYHFEKTNQNFLFVSEVVEKLGKSKNTIYKYLKENKLIGKKFTRVRSRKQCGSPKIWLVYLERK